MHDVNFEVFTDEEHEALNKLIQMGERDSIAMGVLNMTPEKELELQKIADHMRPIPQEFESEAHKQWTINRLKAGLDPSPQSPEEEVEFQKILDVELEEKQKEYASKNLVRTQAITEVAHKKMPTIEPEAPVVEEKVEKKKGRPAKKDLETK